MLRQGSEKAFSELFDKYWESMFDSAFKLLNNRELAQDAVQDVYTDLWKKRYNLKVDSIAGYLHQSIKYKALDQIRKHKIILSDLDYVDHFFESDFADDSVIAQELDTALNDYISQLPDQCQRVFKMSRFENLSNKEIAEQLNISVRTVDNHISKALKFLRPKLEALVAVIAIINF
nr:RNA polymerase sigma-70 factor [Fulvivirga sediminis]